MLANNLRDLDRDIENHRYTLVFYIGRPAGTVLFQLLMYACYFVILMGLLSGIYEWPILVTFLTFSNCEEAFRSIQANITPTYQFQLFHQKYGLIQC